MEYNYISKVDPKKNPIKHIRFPKLTLSKQTIYEKQTTKNETIKQPDIHKKVMPPPKVMPPLKVMLPPSKVMPPPPPKVTTPTSNALLGCRHESNDDLFDNANETMDNAIISNNNIINVQQQNVLLSSSSSSSSSASASASVVAVAVEATHWNDNNRNRTTTSETQAKTIDYGTVQILSQILHLSDSDETNCSSISEENNQPNLVVNVQQPGQPPSSSNRNTDDGKSEELFSNITTSNSRTSHDFPLTQKHHRRISNLSEQIASLELNDHHSPIDDKTIKNVNNDILKMKSTELNYSAQTISSRNTSSNTDTDLTRSPLATSELKDIIEITDDSTDDERQRLHESHDVNVSPLENQQRQQKIDDYRDTIRSSQMYRINNFFDNIPSGNSLVGASYGYQRYSIRSDIISQKTTTTGTGTTTTTTTTTTTKTLNRQTITLANESLIDEQSAEEDERRENSSINVSETTLEDDNDDHDDDGDNNNNNTSDNDNITNNDEDNNDNIEQFLKNSNENRVEIEDVVQSQEVIQSQDGQQIKSKPITIKKRIDTDCNNLSFGKIRIKAKFNINIEIHDSSSTNDDSSSGVSSSSPSSSSSDNSNSNNNNNKKPTVIVKPPTKKPQTNNKKLPPKNTPVVPQQPPPPPPPQSSSTNKKTKTPQQQKLTKNINSKMLVNDFFASPIKIHQNLQNSNNFDCPTLIANHNNDMPLVKQLNLTKLLPTPPPPLEYQLPVPLIMPLENKYLTKVKNVQSGDYCKNKRIPSVADRISIDNTNKDHQSSSSSSSVQIINEDDELLLNEIYGTSWRTPELLNKCRSHKKCLTPSADNGETVDDEPEQITDQNDNNNNNNINISSSPDAVAVTKLTKTDKIIPAANGINPRVSEGFLHFRRNIAIDFDSTRILFPDDPNVNKIINNDQENLLLKTKLLDTVTKRKKKQIIRPPLSSLEDDDQQNNRNRTPIEKSIDEIIQSPFFFQKPISKENKPMEKQMEKGDNTKDKQLNSKPLNEEILSKRYNTRQCRKKVQYAFAESNSDNSLDTNSNNDNKSADDDSGNNNNNNNNEDVDNIFCDDDDDDDDDDSDGDDDWKLEHSASSDSDQFELNDDKNPIQTNRKPNMKNKKKQSKQKNTKTKTADDDDDRIIYLDLTKAEVTEVSESELTINDINNKDKNNNNNNNVDPFKTPYAITTIIKPATTTTETRTKRKLFTPNYDNIPIFDDSNNNNNGNPNDIDENEKRKQFEYNSTKKITNVKLTCPIPEFLLKPSSYDKIKNIIISSNATTDQINPKTIPKPTAPKTIAPQKPVVPKIAEPKTVVPKNSTVPPKPIATPTTKTPTANTKIQKIDIDDEANDKKNNKKGQIVENNKVSNSATKTTFIPKEFNDLTAKNTYGFLQSLDVTTSKELCHPVALQYRNDYKNTKLQLTTILYELYNERIFDGKLDVPITWNKKLLNTAGRCFNTRKRGIRSCRIELSEKVLTSADRLRCTLIHELCHAATWLFNGENGHGTTWKNWTYKSLKIFPELPKIGVSHSYDIEYKYTYKCTKCDTKSYAHSKSKKVENIRCALCHNAIEIFLNKKNKDGKQICTPVRKASGFAAFVKEKYQQYKKPEFTHANVMKQLGVAFGSLSVDQKKKY